MKFSFLIADKATSEKHDLLVKDLSEAQSKCAALEKRLVAAEEEKNVGS